MFLIFRCMYAQRKRFKEISRWDSHSKFQYEIITRVLTSVKEKSIANKFGTFYCIYRKKIIAKNHGLIPPPSRNYIYLISRVVFRTVLHRIILHREKREGRRHRGKSNLAELANKGGRWASLQKLPLDSWTRILLQHSFSSVGEGEEEEGTKKRIVRMNGIKRKKARPAFVNTARSAFKPICMTRRARPALSSYDLPRTEFR